MGASILAGFFNTITISNYHYSPVVYNCNAIIGSQSIRFKCILLIFKVKHKEKRNELLIFWANKHVIYYNMHQTFIVLVVPR